MVGAVRTLFCIIVPNFVKIGQTVADILPFFKMAAGAILDFQKFKILAAGQL